MRAWINQHRFALAGTIKRMAAQPGSTLLNALVLAIALALPLLGYTVLRSLQPVTRELASDPEITVYLTLAASRADAQEAVAQVRQVGGAAVDSVRLVTREQAFTDLKVSAGYGDVLAALPGNPFPDALVVRLRNGENVAAESERLAVAFRSVPKVEQVQVDAAWVKRLEAGLRFLGNGLWMVAVVLAIAVLAVVFNTIRMQVLTQRDEIEVSRLIGATDAFIKRPFYYVGVINGLLGGVLAVALCALALVPLNAAVTDFARAYGTTFGVGAPSPAALAAFLAGTVALGWIGAVLSVARHLGSGATPR